MTWPEIPDWPESELYFRRMWELKPPEQTGGRPWPAVSPAFRFGWEWALNTRFTGRRFDEAEPHLAREWEVAKPAEMPAWEEMREFARMAWERARRMSWGHHWQRRTW